jgi:hypothetical protein
MSDPVLASLETAAESGEDVTQAVNRAFHLMEPEAEGLMDHMDEHMLGRMMQEVLMVLMAGEPEDQLDYLNFEVGSHLGYGVATPMYGSLFAAVRDCVRDLIGDAWSPETETAWNQRIRSLEEIIENAAEARADA